MKRELTIDQLQILREARIISPTEVAYIMGDLLVIENVHTGTKRTESHAVADRLLGENKKRILKG